MSASAAVKPDGEPEAGVGKYQAGLLSEQEVVVSSHFMHAQNVNPANKRYTSEQFAKKAIHMTPDDIMNKIIPALKEASAKLIDQRSSAAAQRARQNYAQYGLSSREDVSVAEIITEAITDRNFRKSNVSDEDRREFRDRIARKIAAGETIQIVAPMLPNKVASPLKTRGVLPGMEEAGLIARLGEIAGIVNKLYPKDKLGDKTHGAEFVIIGDGRRFKNCWRTPEESIVAYQAGIQWWIDQLGFNETVKLADYEHIITKMLSPAEQEERNTHIANAMQEMSQKLDGLLDVMHFDESMKKVIAADPFTEVANSEGRFVPLFKSTLYNIRYPALDLYAKKFSVDYPTLYRDLTTNIAKPFALLDEQASDRVADYIKHGSLTQENAPDEADIKEYLRRSMIAEAWEASKDYLAIVIADRNLDIDPISQGMKEDVIRFSIHSKPGQIGLKTTSENGDPVQAWHGTGQLRPSDGGKKVKISNQSVLVLETEGNLPVLIRARDGASNDENSLLTQFANSDQPLFYIHPDLKVYDAAGLEQVMKKSFSRI